ncbi:phosphonoacetaldehyde hydrolase [Pseudobacillus badius]|uniref:phosphonoacetaldehyde hydrolase n=1 Tax=Bacillus badius TaxID=1455 RepID=UPI003CF72D2B
MKKVKRLSQKIEAVVFDWAGTTVDYGCLAPMNVFVEIFKEKGIVVTSEEVRGPMGMDKWDHIYELCQLDSVKGQWQEKYRKYPEKEDIDELYTRFEPILFSTLRSFAKPIEGAMDVVNILRKQGIKIGSTSGYTKEMLDIVAEEAEKFGYKPDARITSEKVGKGRPFPYMCYANAIQLDIDGMHKMIKVGDTLSDIKEGINAGMWSVGVILGSSLHGFSETEVKRLNQADLLASMEAARTKFYQAGAHFVIDSIKEVPELIEEINKLLQQNIFPHRYTTVRKDMKPWEASTIQ